MANYNITYNGLKVNVVDETSVLKYDYQEHPFKPVKIGKLFWSTALLNINDGGSGIIDRTNVDVNGTIFPHVFYYNKTAINRFISKYPGWRVPTVEETNEMVNLLGGFNSTVAQKLKSTEVWTNPGNNETHFNAIPYGFILHDGTLINVGLESTFWQNDSYRMYILNDNQIVNGVEDMDYKYPLRLVMR